VVAVELAAALSGADVEPVGGTVAGAWESVGVDKGLEQDGSVGVSGGPVVGEAAGGEGEELGGEVGGVDPGEDEESGVVGDEVEMVLSLLGGPADPAVSGGEAPGGGPEAEEGQEPALRSGEVAELGTREAAVVRRTADIGRCARSRGRTRRGRR